MVAGLPLSRAPNLLGHGRLEALLDYCLPVYLGSRSEVGKGAEHGRRKDGDRSEIHDSPRWGGCPLCRPTRSLDQVFRVYALRREILNKTRRGPRP